MLSFIALFINQLLCFFLRTFCLFHQLSDLLILHIKGSLCIVFIHVVTVNLFSDHIRINNRILRTFKLSVQFRCFFLRLIIILLINIKADLPAKDLLCFSIGMFQVLDIILCKLRNSHSMDLVVKLIRLFIFALFFSGEMPFIHILF